LSNKGPAEERVLAADGLSELFGLEIGASGEEHASGATRRSARPVKARRSADAAPATEEAAKAAEPAGLRSSATTKRRTPKSQAKARPKAGARKRSTTKH
jgi:hypothetical protein